MSIVGNEGSTFTQDGKEFRVFHHRKSIKMQGSKPNVHFFWVQPSKFQESPLYPKEADFWSTRFLQHAVTRQESQKQKRSQGDERDNCQQSSNKRSKMSSAQDKGSKELPISQEQVDTTAALVAEKQKLDTASPTNDDDNDTRLPQKRTREEFIAMLKASWHASYPNEPFPEEIISSNESSSRDAIVSDSSDDSKHEQFAKVYHELGPIQYSARLALIENGIKSPSEGFLQKRKKDNLSELFAKMDQEPTINARMRTTGYDMPARLHDKIPISDIRLKDNHSDQLDAELRYRHIVPYLPFGEENKRKHPVPKLAPRTITGRPFDAMTFTQKKNLLMADEECQYRMEYSKENDFREDVDMQKFDTKTFTPLNPNVVFEFPGRTK